MGFQEIDEQEYMDNLITIVNKKNEFLKAKNEYERKTKLAKYAMTKGYESHLVWQVVNDAFKAT
jgi:regulatory protein